MWRSVRATWWARLAAVPLCRVLRGQELLVFAMGEELVTRLIGAGVLDRRMDCLGRGCDRRGPNSWRR